ncbi:THAP domain-containing protein 1-like isoform X3 [Emydura macquarii macquarii]|uniref:THAP domain-containing protein 1-like isoform X3 n=1 Tax=Emydura macquarii macquarii TaxID=1129001 RepID=UPI00352AC442
MVKYCAAYNCNNADTKLSRKQGITFHRFPKDNKKKHQWAQAVHRADPVTGKLWTPSEWDMICSQHFNLECFKEINGKKFLKEGSCPSIFSFPDNFQNPDNSLQRSAKNSKCAGIFLENPPLEADPSVVYVTPVTITKTANTLKRLTENLSCPPEVDTNGLCNTQDTITVHFKDCTVRFPQSRALMFWSASPAFVQQAVMFKAVGELLLGP